MVDHSPQILAREEKAIANTPPPSQEISEGHYRFPRRNSQSETWLGQRRRVH